MQVGRLYDESARHAEKYLIVMLHESLFGAGVNA